MIHSRLQKLLKYYNLSAAKLADEIGVQRSSISHIISGRNKPSMDFIQKLTQTYTDINIDWIINGTGVMKKGATENEANNELNEYKLEIQNLQENIKSLKSKLKQQEYKRISFDSNEESVSRKHTESNTNNRIQKIVIFFDDNTFKDYIPQ